MKKIANLLILSLLIIVCNAQAQEKWSVVTNPNLKGPNGQLAVTVPGEAIMLCMVARSGEARNVFVFHNSGAKELLPGNYDITFRDVKILSVPVEKGKDTRIFAGVLNSTVKGLWEVFTADGAKIFTSGSPKTIALPVGTYTVKTGGAEFKTTINDGKITMFSFTAY
jgi:hypothetical protein